MSHAVKSIVKPVAEVVAPAASLLSGVGEALGVVTTGLSLIDMLGHKKPKVEVKTVPAPKPKVKPVLGTPANNVFMPTKTSFFSGNFGKNVSKGKYGLGDIVNL